MRLRFWRKATPAPPPPEPTEPRVLACKYCGPVDIGGDSALQTPEDHLRTPEHRAAQLKGLAALPESSE